MEHRDFDSNTLDISSMNPLQLTHYSKSLFEQKYFSISQEIKKKISDKVSVIHLNDFAKEYYDVLTPYSGEVQPLGLENLIHRMYGVIGVINTFPILYQDEDKDILRAVAPRYNSQDEQSSQSPYNDLDWHTDAAYRPIMEKEDLSPRPDYLIFGIVHKGHESLPIVYVELNDILNELSSEDIVAGSRADFIVSSPDSFTRKAKSKNVPILIKNKDDSFYSRIAFQHTIALTKSGENFLHKVKDIVEKKKIQNILQVKTGDIVILNNNTTVHKRDYYEPKWDGKDRYFIRIYSVTDLSQGVLSDKSKPWLWT